MKFLILLAIPYILIKECEAFASTSLPLRTHTALAESPMGRRDSFGGMATTLIGAGAVAGLAEFLKDTLHKNADLKRAEANGEVLVSGLKNAASNGTNLKCSLFMIKNV
jgi:hypothetical protein